MENFVLHMFDIEDFPSGTFPDLHSLCKTALKQFSRTKLRSYKNDEPDVFGNKRSPVFRYKLQFSQILQGLLPLVLVKTNWADGFDDGILDISIPETGWGIKLVDPVKANGSGVPVPDVDDPSFKQTLILTFRMLSSGM